MLSSKSDAKPKLQTHQLIRRKDVSAKWNVRWWPTCWHLRSVREAKSEVKTDRNSRCQGYVQNENTPKNRLGEEARESEYLGLYCFSCLEKNQKEVLLNGAQHWCSIELCESLWSWSPRPDSVPRVPG